MKDSSAPKFVSYQAPSTVEPQRKLSDNVTESIVKHQCLECAANPQLSRVPKLSLTAEAKPNVAVSLGVMPHVINNVNVNLLVTVDEGDLMLLLKYLHIMAAPTAFQAYFLRWIVYFYALVYTVVDRGTKLVKNAWLAIFMHCSRSCVPFQRKQHGLLDKTNVPIARYITPSISSWVMATTTLVETTKALLQMWRWRVNSASTQTTSCLTSAASEACQESSENYPN